MKMFFTIVAIISGITTSPAIAEQATTRNTQQPLDALCHDTIYIKVDGLVCDFCARALEKLFGKRADVNTIKVDLDNGMVTVSMKPGQNIDDATLSKLITDSGYNVRNISKGC